VFFNLKGYLVQEQLTRLIALQENDLQIQTLTEQYRLSRTALEENKQILTSKMAEQRSTVLKKDDALKEIALLRQQIETDQQRVRKWEQRLNDIRNQREQQALSREIELQKKANKENESRITALYAEVNALKEKSELQQTEVELLELEYQEKEQQVMQEWQNIEHLIAAAQAKRQQIMSELPAKLIKEYDSIRERRAGVGIVMVESGYCLGCNIKLPPQLYNQLQQVGYFSRCNSCHRIIYIKQEEAPALPESLPEVV
jgi:predicted  nucleic acid-binding Zn-ribbon protein